MSQNEIVITKLTNRYFDDSSLSTKSEPKIVVLMGPPASGKTTIRKENFASGYVLIDAAEIFLVISDGNHFDFPGPFVNSIQTVGIFLTEKAIREKRNIITEITGANVEPTKEMLKAMSAAGYRVEILAMKCDLEVAIERNENRDDDYVSSYYAEPFQIAWLNQAATESTKMGSI